MPSTQCKDDISVPDFLHSIQRDSLRLPSFKAVFNDSPPLQTCGLSLQQQISRSLNTIATTTPLRLSQGSESSETTSPPSSLFQAGFQDCASEVIRFLKDQEKLDGQNPLLLGLRSHLMTLSESIGEDSSHPACTTSSTALRLKDSSNSCYDDNTISIMSSTPVLSTGFIHDSRHSKTLTASTTSSQILVSERSEEERKLCRRKRSSDSALCLSPLSPRCTSSVLFEQDHSLSPVPAKRACCTHRSEDSEEVPSLSYLAAKAIKVREITPPSGSQSKLGSGCSLPRSDNVIISPALSSPQSSHFTSYKTSFSHQLVESFTPSPSKPVLSSPCGSQEGSSKSQSFSFIPPPSSLLTTETVPAQVCDISTLTGDNLDDVMRSVESCQSHDDPRVRDLAAHIISLISDFDDEEDEEIDDNVDNDIECEGHRQEFEDSGIDLEDD